MKLCGLLKDADTQKEQCRRSITDFERKIVRRSATFALAGGLYELTARWVSVVCLFPSPVPTADSGSDVRAQIHPCVYIRLVASALVIKKKGDVNTMGSIA